MQFTVRYWSTLLPDHHKADGEPHWVDYSIHPATKLGLHNALLTLHDRRQILELHGGRYDCAVFYIEAGEEQQLTQEAAEHLFGHLPHGEIRGADIRHFLLPPPAPPPEETPEPEAAALEQLSLFEPHHTPYDDVKTEGHHELDANA